MGTFPEYSEFLSRFAKAGYNFATMSSDTPPPKGVIYLRHDIDFDTDYALRMAKAESDMGVCATYYFMLSSDSYNLLSDYNSRRVKEIAALGHKVSLHFDPVIYEDMEQGLVRESAVFTGAFEVNVDVVSIHRPTEYILSHEGEIAGIAHTYQRRYSKNIFYCSDSQGKWRFGSPLDSQAFQDRNTIHLLTHPIWWMRDEADPQALLDGYVSERIGRFLTHIEANCKSYSSISSIHRMGTDR